MRRALAAAFRTASPRAAGLVAGGSVVAGGLAIAYSPAESAAAPSGRLILSGDCGGTNTRLALYLIPAGVKAETGVLPKGELVYTQHYRNSDNSSFTSVCQKFLAECSPKTGGAKPQVCCLACAGGISDNSVSFTNVAEGWTINGNALQETLGIKEVKLINDFEAQGYGLLTLGPEDYIQLNDAKIRPGAPKACVGAGTGLGECYLTAGLDGEYICWPSEGGHAEFSPRSVLTGELINHLRHKLAFDTHGAPEKIREYFDSWDTKKDGVIHFDEFELAMRHMDIEGMKPRRVSVERVVSGPGIASVYGFLREHWAFEHDLSPTFDKTFTNAKADERGRVVAECADSGNKVCKKAIDMFNECYGSEVGVAALKWLPYGGLYISGGIGAKNPQWVQSKEFMEAYKDKGRLSSLTAQVPLFLVTTEDTGERGALFYAVRMLGSI